MPLKVSCIVFSIASIILWYIFSCKCFNWVTWHMLAPCYDYLLVTLSLYEHLVGRIPVFLLASTCIVLPMHPTIKSHVFQQCPPYLPICGISLPLICGLFMCYL